MSKHEMMRVQSRSTGDAGLDLVAAVVNQAIRDATRRNDRTGRQAKRWLDEVFPNWKRELEKHK